MTPGYVNMKQMKVEVNKDIAELFNGLEIELTPIPNKKRTIKERVISSIKQLKKKLGG